MTYSKLDGAQIIKTVYNEADDSINVTLTDVSLELSASDGDSVRAFGGEEPSVAWDYYSQALSAADTVVTRTYRTGGAAGTVVGTTVTTYSSNARTFIVSFLRT